jgi:hypothetical protein
MKAVEATYSPDGMGANYCMNSAGMCSRPAICPWPADALT